MSETTVKESETTVTDVDETDTDTQSYDDGPTDEEYTGWFASSALRMGLAIVGFFLLLAALGQLSGIDLIGMGADALNTSAGRWFVVAVVAIVLMVVAARGFSNMGPE